MFPIKSGGYYAGSLKTINRPLRKSSRPAQPGPHYGRNGLKQYKDTDTDADHIIQEEVLEAFRVDDIWIGRTDDYDKSLRELV